MTDTNKLFDIAARLWEREEQPIYVWLSPDGDDSSWALSSDRDDHLTAPDFIYNGQVDMPNRLRLV